MPIGHGFSFLVMEKSWNINVEKEGAPCLKLLFLSLLMHEIKFIVWCTILWQLKNCQFESILLLKYAGYWPVLGVISYGMLSVIAIMLSNNSTPQIAIFQDNPDKPVPECHNSGFYWS